MKRSFLQWHRRLAWLGGFVVLCWGLSGILHPVMSWFGPQAVTMFPPARVMPEIALPEMAKTLEANAVKEARVVKLVPTAEGFALQLTENDLVPRRYFSLRSRAEMPGYDESQARWLASYYTGRPVDSVASVTFQTAFSEDYPSVNRLLPVYRVGFAGDDELTAFVHTETAALASLNNRNKAAIQRVFLQLHTWAWLDVTGFGRVLLVMLFMVTLFLMACAGLALIVLLPQRRINDGRRRWHRWFGYALWLPLLAWSASGIYHLLQGEYIEPVSGMRLGESMALAELPALDVTAVPKRPISAASLVPVSDGTLRYRLALAPVAGLEQAVSRAARFDGQPSSSGVIYLGAAAAAQYSDRDQAVWLARQFRPNATIESVERITRFGPDYDFRNKRLPVWKVNLADAAGTQLFVDPATGVLVDQSRTIDRAERWSFSILHKWNHLTGITGRAGRDALMVATLMLALFAAVLGGIMLIRRGRAH